MDFSAPWALPPGATLPVATSGHVSPGRVVRFASRSLAESRSSSSLPTASSANPVGHARVPPAQGRAPAPQTQVGAVVEPTSGSPRFLSSGALPSDIRARSQSPSVVHMSSVPPPAYWQTGPFLAQSRSLPSSSQPRITSRSPSPSSQAPVCTSLPVQTQPLSTRRHWSPVPSRSSSAAVVTSRGCVGGSGTNNAGRATPTPGSARSWQTELTRLQDQPVSSDARLCEAQQVAKSARDPVRQLKPEVVPVVQYADGFRGFCDSARTNAAALPATAPLGCVRAPALPSTLRRVPMAPRQYQPGQVGPRLITGRPMPVGTRSTGALLGPPSAASTAACKQPAMDSTVRTASVCDGSVVVRRSLSPEVRARPALSPIHKRASSPPMPATSPEKVSVAVTSTMPPAVTPPAPASGSRTPVEVPAPQTTAVAVASEAAEAGTNTAAMVEGGTWKQDDFEHVENLVETIQASLRGAKSLVDAAASDGPGCNAKAAAAVGAGSVVGSGGATTASVKNTPSRQRSPRDYHWSPREALRRSAPGAGDVLRHSPASIGSSMRQVGGCAGVSASSAALVGGAGAAYSPYAASERSYQGSLMGGSLHSSVAGSAIFPTPFGGREFPSALAVGQSPATRWRPGPPLALRMAPDPVKADAGVQACRSPMVPQPIGCRNRDDTEDWALQEGDANLCRWLERLQLKLHEVSMEVSEVQQVAKSVCNLRSRGGTDEPSTRAFTEDSTTSLSSAVTASTCPPRQELGAVSRPNTPPAVSAAPLTMPSGLEATPGSSTTSLHQAGAGGSLVLASATPVGQEDEDGCADGGSGETASPKSSAEDVR